MRGFAEWNVGYGFTSGGITYWRSIGADAYGVLTTTTHPYYVTCWVYA